MQTPPVGFYTHSLALIADAFHYMNDLIGFIVALVALKISRRPTSPKRLSFGWQRAQLLGAFFNGVFLLALGVSIFLQSLERFVSLQGVENPMLVLIMGCVGLTLNIISAIFLHEHDGPRSNEAGGGQYTGTIQLSELTTEDVQPHDNHRHKLEPSKKSGHDHDLGMMGVLIHVIGDAINNIGVIIAAAVIWKAEFEGRFYADPGVSMGISFLILISSLPLVKNSGSILLQCVPLGVNLEDVKHDLEKIPGITSVHELHAWRLSQNKAIASAHVVTLEQEVVGFMGQAKLIGECLHAYGIHSTTLQPEFSTSTTLRESEGEGQVLLKQISSEKSVCQIKCGKLCENLTCCG
ncbi:Zinc/cadmium resistance protein [Lachnellula hyalina]|uniref:Zinc/cadmium resistance protein n=1 Tax=Lachnellula hyalina TaxID=1316788 RepID=A0A8H8R6D9_9HELO|nr:Zinc/cadmium resistance protein [Lachnellula hyalina]TVY28846.1 Zinc/cadmium resistance protein [Lachnellula hyalina]